jgi:hypothetical protein
MINRLIELSLRNRFIVTALFIALAGWGWWAVRATPIDAIPDLSDNQVIVFTDWPGHSPQEVEDLHDERKIAAQMKSSAAEYIGCRTNRYGPRLMIDDAPGAAATRNVPFGNERRAHTPSVTAIAWAA